jgi:hypothetical protein
MRRVVPLVLLLACAPIPPRTSGPPIPRTPEQVAASCREDPINDEKGQPIDSIYTITCPLPAGYRWEDVAWFGFAGAAVTALFRDLPEYVMVRKPAPQGEMQSAFFFPEIDMLPTLRAEQHPGWTYVRPEQALSPAAYAYFRYRATVFLEDRAYDKCSRVVMNPEIAAQQAAYAQACVNTMAVIDRSRATRREEEERNQRRFEVENQQLELKQINANLELARTEAAAARRQEALRSFTSQPVYQPTPIFPQTTHTTCHASGGNSLDCTSQGF